MDKRKCALYGRVSTQRQAVVEDGGLDTQFNLMKRFVEFENEKAQEANWVTVGNYREEGKSGKNLERPEFKRMMADIESGRINTVIVPKIDRITRSLRDFYTLWEKFEELDVQFISIHEKFDTTNAVGRAMLKLILVFAELEREQTAERTSATMQHRAEQGLFNFKAPLGYERSSESTGVLVPHETEREIVVKDFFEKCVELGSASKVVRHLHDQGIRRPKYITKKTKEQRGGGKFHKQAVLNLLQNKTYLGKIEYKDEVYDGKHEPIVDEALFNRVQAIIHKNRVKSPNCIGRTEHVFLLQGLARCGKCGSMMAPKWSTGRNKKRHFYYQCTKQNHSNKTECDARYLPAQTAENFVVEQICEWADDRSAIEKAIVESGKYKSEALAGVDVRMLDVRNQMLEVEAGLSRFASAVEGGASFRTFEERMASLEKDREKLESRLLNLELEKSSIESESLSKDVLADTYCDFPFIVDKLREQRRYHDLGEILSCYIEAIDVHQEPDDPSSGHMNIMLFERELKTWIPPVKGVKSSESKRKNARSTALTARCCERLVKLPR